jgi:hypothetical protein
MKITREQLKETLRTIMKEEAEYQQFFKKALEKAGKSITDMSDEEKKDFFNKIDSAWDGKGEKKNEGNAFGAAVTAAKEKGEDSFEVGGKTYKVESVNEALLPADTKVVSAFFDKKPLEGRNLNTDGKVLKTAGIGSQEMYIHTPKGVKMVGKVTGKYAQSLVQFVNKNYKSDLVESVNGEIKVGQMVKVVDNPHWEAALGKKGPFKRKVKGIYGDSVFFTDGSNSSMKYVKESVESVNEGRAFINAAKKAKAEGKTEFEFNGKKYPVTIKD